MQQLPVSPPRLHPPATTHTCTAWAGVVPWVPYRTLFLRPRCQTTRVTQQLDNYLYLTLMVVGLGGASAGYLLPDMVSTDSKGRRTRARSRGARGPLQGNANTNSKRSGEWPVGWWAHGACRGSSGW